MNRPKKVAVIGAGMIGVATASWLLRDGHEVTLIDPFWPICPPEVVLHILLREPRPRAPL